MSGKQLKERGLRTVPWLGPHEGDKKSAERLTREKWGSPEAVQGREADQLCPKLLIGGGIKGLKCKLPDKNNCLLYSNTVVNDSNPSAQKPEAGGSLTVWDKPRLHSSQNNNKENMSSDNP